MRCSGQCRLIKDHILYLHYQSEKLNIEKIYCYDINNENKGKYKSFVWVPKSNPINEQELWIRNMSSD